jgi:asparagine synthase (glutamine-hydrolysing)
MCGICGVSLPHLDAPVDPAVLRQMTDLLTHRGPDSDGYHIRPSIGLGVRRLSIIDLENGDQPITNENGTVTLTCNGEIYNFHELRKELQLRGHRFRTQSDVEVIIHLYEEEGPGCLSHLRGMFAFALWDSTAHRLMLARDRLGIKPLHYAITPDRSLYFASELKSILFGNQLDRTLDLVAFHNCFFLGFVTGERTFFKSIRRLLPGHYLLYREGELSINQYWDVRFPDCRDSCSQLSDEEWSEGFLEKLQESVRLHLRSDVEMGCLLSAGIDSSAVAALASKIAPGPRQAFSLGFENPDYDEITSNRLLSDYSEYELISHRAKCLNRHFSQLPRELWYQEDPGPAGNWVTTSVLTAKASQHVKTVLCGEGADELLGGYRWFHIHKLLQPIRKLPRPVGRLLLMGSILGRFRSWFRSLHHALGPLDLDSYSILLGSRQPHLTSQIFSDDLKASLASTELPPTRLPCPEDFEDWHPFLQLQYYEMKTRLPDYIVRRLDRASMSHSLEVRVPFLDHVLVEYCSRVPPSLKMSLLREKTILRKACRRLLPPEIAGRRKRGLEAPVNEWFRQPLPDFVATLLSSRELASKGYFDPEVVTTKIRAHRAGRARHGHKLLRILQTQLWDEIFVRGRSVASF